MALLNRLKRIDALRHRVKRAKVYREYFHDARLMNQYLLDGGADPDHDAYRIMLAVHSLEKGLSYRAPRAFGAEKAVRLVELMLAASDPVRASTAYRMGAEVLAAWLSFHDAREASTGPAHHRVRSFLAELESDPVPDTALPAGTRVITNRDATHWGELPFDRFVRTRHSTRRYAAGALDDAVVRECVELALLSPSACNRQMVRVHFFDEEREKTLLYRTLHGTGGIDFDTCRLGIVTFDTKSLEFFGERNQGYLNAGLFAMTLVYAFHWRGIGSCLLQFGNTFKEERMLVRELGLPDTERIAVGISIGVLESDDVVPASVRRRVDEVVNLPGPALRN